MTCLNDHWPPFVFSCDGWYKFDDNFGKIPFGAKILNGTKRERRMLKTKLEQGSDIGSCTYVMSQHVCQCWMHIDCMQDLLHNGREVIRNFPFMGYRCRT